jgi:hypothetical protein
VKVGILTFHRAENFGAALQAFALQEYIASLGHEVEIIDYRNKAIERHYQPLDITILLRRKNVFASIRTLLCNVFTYKTQMAKKKKYERFREKYLRISKKVFTFPADIKGGYDAYICGSDQIWNCGITGGLDPVYFLAFPMSGRRIAYAASAELGAYRCFENSGDKIKVYLDNFDALSVREETLALCLGAYTSKEIEVVLDPTLLFDKEWYEGLIETTAPCGGVKYALVYYVYESRKASWIARQEAANRRLPLMEIHAGFKPFLDKKIHKQDLSPLEILALFYKAEVIVCTSFHGVALSIILNKEFYCINTPGIIRQRDLLKKLNLENRIIDSIDDIDGSIIEYKATRTLMQNYINKSKQYIMDALR